MRDARFATVPAGTDHQYLNLPSGWVFFELEGGAPSVIQVEHIVQLCRDSDPEKTMVYLSDDTFVRVNALFVDVVQAVVASTQRC